MINRGKVYIGLSLTLLEFIDELRDEMDIKLSTVFITSS